MKVNIYYGGRGLIDDPAIFVMNKLITVLDELNVKVEKYNLYELKNTITTLPQTFKDADGVILATTVEWFGIGGFMHSFLDACWLYGDKDRISQIYMFPVVMAKAYGEKEAELSLINAWDMLGGKSMQGLTAYVDENSAFEFNPDYVDIIEKYAEGVYRTISQKKKSLPSSNNGIRQQILKETITLTPQESERLSTFAADDDFVATQKRDIEELSSLFREMLNDQESGGDDYYANVLTRAYVQHNDFTGSYLLIISDKGRNVLININKGDLKISIVNQQEADVIGKLSRSVFDNICAGRMTFQRAFMSGEMTAKGNFKTLKMLDELFVFGR